MFARKMFSKKQILSAMAGVAMLALPVSALAGHHDDDDWNRPRPYAQHDQGWHQGWMRKQWKHGGWNGTPAQRPPVNYAQPVVQPYGWNNGDEGECDRDGDRCEQAYAPAPVYQPYAPPNYGYNPGAWGGDQDGDEGGAYSSYLQPPPTGNNRSQSLGWLIAKRQQTMVTIAQLRARHDSRGAARLVPVVTALNRRIAALNRVGYNGGYAPPQNYATGAPSNALPYNGGSYYNGGYSGAPYTGNPTVDALSSLAVPFLSGVR